MGKDWKLLYSKAGIAKLEIRRKINQLELLIHAARPKALNVNNEEDSTFIELRNKIRKILNKPKQIRIKVIQIAKTENETTQRLQKSGIKGFKIQVSGRLNGAEMARAEWVRDGRVPLQTLRADISYSTHRANTIYGVLGIKVWIFDKEIFQK